MQMTLDAQKKVAVQEVLAEKIMERLEKLAATEEQELRARFAAIPARVYETTLERLATMELIRRVRSKDGIVFVARASATKEHLAQAANRYRKAEASSERRVKARKQMERDCDVQFYAKPAPTVAFPEFPEDCIYRADEDAFLETFDWKTYSETEVADEHYSELPTFGLSYEAAASASHEEAILAFGSDAAETASRFNDEKVATKEIGAYQQSLIERQIQTGQGKRNAKRARNRYYERDEIGRTIKAIREMERAAFDK